MATGEQDKVLKALRDGAEGDLVSWKTELEASSRFGVPLREVDRIALEAGLLPGRYRRNRETIPTESQLKLFRSRVVVIGCGGLGGYLIEELARVGVGTLVLVDPDVFEEHNLNRQLLSTPGNLGRPKAQVAAERVREINPAVETVPLQVAFGEGNAAELISGADVVADALDNVLVRRQLSQACRRHSVPLVHGAIGGWYGQIATQLVGDDLSPILKGSAEGKGVEKKLGNPAFTPAVVASLEATEVCKVLLSKGTPLSKRVLFVNLLDMEMDQIRHD